MLTLTDIPAAISFTRNPVEFRLQATDGNGDPYGAKGATAEVTMNSNGLQVNDTFKVEWTEPDGSTNSLTFTAKNIPVNELQVQAQPSGLPAFDYFETVATQLQAHSLLAAFFTVMADSPSAGFFRITFTALNTSVDFSVSLNIAGIDAGSNATTSSTAAIADNTPDEYSIYLNVFFEADFESGSFEKVAELEAKPDADGYVCSNIQSILLAQAKLSFSENALPDLTATPAPFPYHNIRRYYIRYRENYEGIYDNPLNPDGNWSTTDPAKAMLGGLDQALWSDIDFFGNMDASNSLLTWYPDRKTIGAEQPEFLPWFNWSAFQTDIILELKRQTATATLPTLYIFGGAATAVIPSETTALVPVGVAQLETAGTDMDDVVKYTVRIVNDASDWEGGNPVYLSPPRVYYIDRSHYEEQHFIIYLNSFYCPLTLRCTGALTKTLEVVSQESSRILPREYDGSFSEMFTNETDWENSFTYRSGFLGKLEVDALQELLIYRQAWEITAGGYRTLMLQGKKFNISETLQHLHAIEFKAVRSLKTISYSCDTAASQSANIGEDFWALEDSDLFELEGSTDLWQLENS